MPLPAIPFAAVNNIEFLTIISVIGAIIKIVIQPHIEYIEKERSTIIREMPMPPYPTKVSLSARIWSTCSPATIIPSPKSVRPSKCRNLLPK